MFQSIRQLHILNKIFNVNGNEWPKVVYAWILRFLYRISFVIGWTILVGMFVTKYGIASLPYLFILNAIFSIIGSAIYSLIQGKFQLKTIMVFTVLIAGISLLAGNIFFVDNTEVFFGLMIMTVGLFLTQLKIILSAYLEEFFSSLQGERTFPLIESAETIGGIFAGLLLFGFSSLFSTLSFIYLAIGLLVFLVPVILWHKDFDHIVHMDLVHKKADSKGVISEIGSILKKKDFGQYFKGLIAIVMFQWLIFNLMEFQYTQAVYKNVSDVILEAGSGFEHAFIHDLGILFVIFSTSSLIIQLFLGSRMINYLGIVGSLLLHPFVTLFSLLGMTGHFTFNTAVLAKNNFTITTVIHTNAYHLSYYALREEFRERVREFLEGIIRPMGAIIGTALIIFLEYFLESNELIFSINVLMILATAILFYVTYTQQDRYTKVALNDLQESKDISVRKNALDILAQRGHRIAFEVLKKIIFEEKELISIRIRALKAIAVPQNVDAILEIVKCFEDKNFYIREAALDVLIANKAFGIKRENFYLKYVLVGALKKIYSLEKHEIILKKIIYLMSLISNVSMFEFLFKVLERKDGLHKVEALYALGKYRDPDIAEVLKPYLDSKDPAEQINAAVALYNFKQYREEAKYHIRTFLYSKDESKAAYGLFAVGELLMRKERYLAERYLGSEDLNLKINAAVALAKFGYKSSIPVLVHLLLSKNDEVVRQLKYLLSNVDVYIKKIIDKIVRQVVSKEIENLKSQYGELSLKKMSSGSLLHLKRLYELINEYEEVEKINHELKLLIINN